MAILLVIFQGYVFLRFIIRIRMEQDQKRGMGSSSESDSDYYYYFVTLKKKRLRIDAFLLPQNATYNPVNRRIRDPYVRWCERRTSSERSGGAVYSIVSCPSLLLSLIIDLYLEFLVLLCLDSQTKCCSLPYCFCLLLFHN